MLPLLSILVGAIFLMTFSLMLWVMLARPTKWARFTEKENDFWVRRGIPVKWAGACKEFEQGRGLKVLVAFCIVVALVLIATASFLPFIVHHH